MEKKLKYTRIALVFLVLLLLATSIWFWQEHNKNAAASYETKSGEKYHRDTCRYAEDAKSITLIEAIEKGYEPCSVCNPPRVK